MSVSGPMMILRCRGCGGVLIPPKVLCAQCDGEVFQEYAASGRGRIYTFTTIYVSPEQFRAQTPYDVAIVTLEEGIKVTARVLRRDGKAPAIDDPVRFVREDEMGFWFEVA